VGLSTKKQKTTSTQNTSNTSNSTATTTPNVPDWLLNPAKQVAGNVSGLLGTPASNYAPTISGLQQQTFNQAGSLAPSPYFGQAADAANGVQDVQGQSVLDNLSAYYNPFKDQVLNPVLADYDEQAGITRAAQAAQGAQGAFRGSRFGIREGQTEGELARGRASTEGGLLGNMYTQATALSGQDADRRQAAALANQGAGFQRAGLLANLGTASGNDARANLGLQGELGAQQSAAQNAIRQYPITYAGQQEGLLSGLNTGDYSGRTVDQSGTETGTMTGTSTTTSNPGLLAGLGQAAQIAALFI